MKQGKYITVKKNKEYSILREALLGILPFVKRVAVFSVVTNILILAPSWYMLEVYDRVVNSRSYKTLLMLTMLVVGIYVLLELLEWIRGQVMYQAGLFVDRTLRKPVFQGVFAARLQNQTTFATQALRDMKVISDFIGSKAMLAFIDAPLALMVLILIYLIKPYIGWFALAGAVVQFVIGAVNERRIRVPMQEANQGNALATMYANGVIRNAQVIESMGMFENIHDRWLKRQSGFIHKQAVASDHAGTNAALSKMVQSLQSSLILGFGCWFALRGQLSGSLMIVASILGGRVLAPLVQLIGSWRQVIAVRESYDRLGQMLEAFPPQEQGMPLPPPKGFLAVEQVIAGPPQSSLQIIKGISFRLAPGSTLAIVGPSASGKTTLARLLVGIWPTMSGKVRLDGSDIYTWNKDQLGPSIGYLPQTIELFEGTIAENIARFGEVDEALVAEACQMVGLDSLIESLPLGYATPVGEDGAFLSGGERQRVALARAIYGRPSFVVLDEPNSSLDERGDHALIETIKQLKERKTTLVVISHRKNILSVVDNMIVLVDGQMQTFGKTSEVLAAMQQAQQQQQQPAKPSLPSTGTSPNSSGVHA